MGRTNFEIMTFSYCVMDERDSRTGLSVPGWQFLALPLYVPPAEPWSPRTYDMNPDCSWLACDASSLQIALSALSRVRQVAASRLALPVRFLTTAACDTTTTLLAVP